MVAAAEERRVRLAPPSPARTNRAGLFYSIRERQRPANERNKRKAAHGEGDLNVSGWPLRNEAGHQTKATIIVVFVAFCPPAVDVICMITSRQVRAARALLGWTQETLADKALVALTALKRFESESGLQVREDTRDRVRAALEASGVMFLVSERGEGVMLVRKPEVARKAARRRT